ncbi:hypothetical protein R5O24_07735 [Tenacibaculum maritimum]|uniref:hypothetical protein n=1 Tax=Tenacibaculum maritimum TaxID=107401 RepID=UPI00388EFC0F
MLRVYHRVKINKDLLRPEKIQFDKSNAKSTFSAYLKGHETTTLPAGKLVGIVYNAYPFSEFPIGGMEGRSILPANQAFPFYWSQTDIRILDSKSREITEETDISDYRHKLGGHVVGFKNVHMLNDADTAIRIEWETLGTKPICGEFVFMIEQEDCECR